MKKNLKILSEWRRSKKLYPVKGLKWKSQSVWSSFFVYWFPFRRLFLGARYLIFTYIKQERKLMSIFIIFLVTFGYLLKTRSVTVEKNSQIITKFYTFVLLSEDLCYFSHDRLSIFISLNQFLMKLTGLIEIIITFFLGRTPVVNVKN